MPIARGRLSFLADNPFYTQRFAYYVGRRCRSATIKDIAEELRLDWDAVKGLDKQYMRAQLKRAGARASLTTLIRRTSISSKMRNGPLDKSRTCRLVRS